MSRKNPNKRLDLTKKGDVERALAVMMSSDDDEDDGEEADYYGYDEEYMTNAALDKIQNEYYTTGDELIQMLSGGTSTSLASHISEDLALNVSVLHPEISDIPENTPLSPKSQQKPTRNEAMDTSDALPSLQQPALDVQVPSPETSSISPEKTPLSPKSQQRPTRSEAMGLSDAQSSLQQPAFDVPVPSPENDNRSPEKTLNSTEPHESLTRREVNNTLDAQASQPALDIVVPSLDVPLPSPESPEIRIPVRGPRPTYSAMQNRERLWTTSVNDFDSPSFDKPLEVRKVYTNRSTPKDYFLDIFPESLIDMIAENTNIYAKEKGSRGWKDVTRQEISAYLGVMVLMSINPIPDCQLYWSTDVFYKNPVICEVMTLKRLKKITENIHVNDIREELPKTSPNYDKLCKVRPLVQKLNETFHDACTQSQTQSIDESMIKFKGRSSMKQYMPKKPIKRGYKCWARCDAKTGYLYQFQFYTGKVGNTSEENLGYRVVLDLSENVPENTLLAFDRFFSSLGLLTALYENKIFAVGTVHTNRKGLPLIVTKKTRENTLEPGEFIYQYSNPISVLKWKDTKDVFVCTTGFDPTEVVVIKRKQKDGSKKEMFCPLAIKKYTEYMGGVDIFDHYKSSYPLGKKSRKNWHRIFWFLVEAAIINSYIIYMKDHSVRRNTHREFRLRLGRALIDNFSSREKRAPVFKSKKGGQYGVPDETRLGNVGTHMPKMGKYRRCRYCSTRAKEQRSKYFCSKCLVPLCAAPCFENYHCKAALRGEVEE